MPFEDLKKSYPQFNDEIFYILSKPGNEWTNEEGNLIASLTKKHRQTLKDISQKLRPKPSPVIRSKEEIAEVEAQRAKIENIL